MQAESGHIHRRERPEETTDCCPTVGYPCRGIRQSIWNGCRRPDRIGALAGANKRRSTAMPRGKSAAAATVWPRQL